VNTYTYDGANRLTTVHGQPALNGSEGSVVSYRYNGLGDRLQQTVNGQTTTFTMDLASGLTQVLDDGANTYLYGNGRIAQVNGSSAQYFLADALGSVRQMTNASGVVVMAKAYDPYGVNTQTLAFSGVQTRYGYTGEQSDSTGMVYLRSRYYAPGMGRFISRDTWGGDDQQPMSYNYWNYTDGNPINRMDPFGSCWVNGPSAEEIPGNTWPGPCSLVGRVKNPKNSDAAYAPESITWNPSVQVNLASDIAQGVPESQYTVNGFEKGALGYNLCGQISLTMILETATGVPDLLHYIWAEGLHSTKGLTSIDDLIESAARVFPKQQEWQGRTYVFNAILFYDGLTGISHWEKTGGSNWYGEDWQGLDVYPKVKSILAAGHYVIAGVTIGGSWGQVVSNGETGHWVVVTGLSRQWEAGSEDSAWNWVRVNNPFSSRVEYYPWQYFKDSMHEQSFALGELWHNK